MLTHEVEDFDVADALEFIVENPGRVTRDEMLVVMAEAASTIEELRRSIDRAHFLQTAKNGSRRRLAV